MPVRITLLINRLDEAGWSETYWSGQTSFSAAAAQFAPVLAARQACLAAYCYVWGIRYSFGGTLRQSQLAILGNPTVNPTGGGGSASLAPDAGTLGALGQLQSTTGRRESRLIRGLPDAWIEWSSTVYRMVLSPGAYQGLNTFYNALAAPAATLGWFPRSSLNEMNSKTANITLVSQPDAQHILLTVDGGATYNPATDAVLIVSGFRGVSAPLNGAYSNYQWRSPSTPTLLLTKSVAEAALPPGPPVGAMVRVSNPTVQPFNTYQYNGLVSPWTLVRSRNIGNPFGRTRGRRRRVG